MACFGGMDGHFDGLQVTHFTDDDDVRIFTQGGAQGVLEGTRVVVQFALRDVAAFGLINDFDWVFDGDDMVVAMFVDEFRQGGHRRGFTGAGRACDENQALPVSSQFFNDFWLFETKLVNRRDGVFDDTVGSFDAESVEKEVRAVAVILFDVVAVVEIVMFIENRPLFICERSVVEIFGGFSREDLLVGHEIDFFVATNERIGAGGNMHVTAFAFAGLVEEVVQQFSGGITIHIRRFVEDGPSFQPSDFLFWRLLDFRLSGRMGRRSGGRGGRHGNRRGGSGRARFQRRDIRRRG